MGLFRRRRPGRHQLGSAVRDIPYAAPPVVPHPPMLAQRLEGPRVELGFRDGTTAALAPESAQARALVALADVLTQHD
jgi:hypothetical protein